METMIAAGMTAIVTLLIALIGIVPRLNGISKDSERNKQDLSREHQDLKSLGSTLAGNIKETQTTLTFLKEERLKEQSRQALLRSQQPDAQKALEVLQLTLSRVAELERQLQQAQSEKQALQQEIAALRQEIHCLHAEQEREDDWEPEP